MTDLPQFESALWHIVGQHRDSGTNDAAIAESLRRMALRLTPNGEFTLPPGGWLRVHANGHQEWVCSNEGRAQSARRAP